MANIEGDLRTFVLASAGSVVSYVSSAMYLIEAPQEVDYPYIVYTPISDPMESVSFDRTTTRSPRFQFDIYSDDMGELIAIENALVSRLRWYQGSVSSIVAENISVANMFKVRQEGTQAFRSVVDAIITYNEG